MLIRKRQPNIVALSNPNAGKNTPRAGLGRVVGEILTHPTRVYDTATLGELRETVKKICRDRPDIIVIPGGDGTVHCDVTAVINEYHKGTRPLPKFVIVPVGTMNNVATSLGVGGPFFDPLVFAKRIAAKLESGAECDTAYAHAIELNGDSFGFIYGAGTAASFLERYYAGRPNLGPKRAVVVILESLVDELLGLLPFRKAKHLLTSPVHAIVRTPADNSAPYLPNNTHTVILAGSVEQVGLGCHALSDARAKPGHFMARSCQLSFWGLFASLGQLWTGLSMPFTHDQLVSELVIEYETPTVRTIDGEMLPPATRDVLRCGPRLKFIVG